MLSAGSQEPLVPLWESKKWIKQCQRRDQEGPPMGISLNKTSGNSVVMNRTHILQTEGKRIGPGGSKMVAGCDVQLVFTILVDQRSRHLYAFAMYDTGQYLGPVFPDNREVSLGERTRRDTRATLTTTPTPADSNAVGGVEVRFPPSLPCALQEMCAPPRFAADISRFIGRNWREGAQKTG